MDDISAVEWRGGELMDSDSDEQASDSGSDASWIMSDDEDSMDSDMYLDTDDNNRIVVF